MATAVAPSTGAQARWVSDITNLYDVLREMQGHFGISQTAIPSNPGTISTTAISNITSAMASAVSSQSKLQACSYSAPSNPTRGTLITPSSLTATVTGLNKLNSICNFNAFNGSCFGFGFNSSCFGFGFNSSCFGFGFNSCFGFSDDGFGQNSSHCQAFNNR